MNREPTAIISAIGGLLASIVKVAVLLNIVDWDADQLAGISLVIDNALLVLGVLFIRSQVTPVKSPVLPEGTEVATVDKAGNSAGTTTV